MSPNLSMRCGGVAASRARREQLIVEAVSQVQQIRALLECVWPAASDTGQQPFKSSTWVAAMSVVLERDGAALARTRRLGWIVARLRCDAGSPDPISRNRALKLTELVTSITGLSAIGAARPKA
jgi:hypothetical protein